MKNYYFPLLLILVLPINSYGVTVSKKIFDNATLVDVTPIPKSQVKYFKNSDKKPSFICYAGIAVFGRKSEDVELLKDRLLQESAKLGGEMVVASEEGLRINEIYSDDKDVSVSIPEKWNDRTLTAYVCKIQKAGLGIAFQQQTNGDFQVKYVGKNSPAEKVGITEGMIVLTINGRRFSWEVLDSEVCVKNIGDIVEVEYLDQDKVKKSVIISLDSIPEM